MNTLITFAILLLAGLASSLPVADEVVTITSEFFPESFAVYSSQHDIVNLLCPLNSVNFDEESNMDTIDDSNIAIFFIEADIVDGEYDYKGLYILKNKEATKLLDNGRDFAASTDDSKKVFFAATDGIYVYTAPQNSVEKYGTIDDSLIGIAIPTELDFFYVLTAEHVLYKVKNGGTEKELVSDVKDATQIVTDFDNNLFFVDSKKNVYVKNSDGVKKVKGLPSNPSFSKLVRPPFALDEGVPYIAGKKVFEITPNGTSEYANLVLQSRPTAYAVEAALIQYHAYEKKIYQYDLLAIVLGEIALDKLKVHLEDKTDDIKSIGAKSRKSFRRPK